MGKTYLVTKTSRHFEIWLYTRYLNLKGNKMGFFNDGFTYKSYFNIIKQIIEGLYSKIDTKKTKGGLLFQYNEDESINACAYTNLLGQDCLEMNVGTITYYFAYMKSVMSDNRAFMEFGNAKLEKGNVVTGCYEPHKRALFFNGGPKDPVRDSLSTMLSIIALRFVMAHEFGHLFNGHCAFLKTLYAVPRSEMIIKKQISVLSEAYALDRRTMEMDADAFAATSSIDNIMMFYQQWETNGDLEPFDGFTDKTQLFKIWSFAVHSVFLISEGLHKTEYSKFSLYLPNEARAMLVFNASLNTLDGWIRHGIFRCTEEERRIIEQEIICGYLEAESYFNRKFGFDFIYILSTQGNTIYVNYAQEVLNHWNKKLRKKLERYARVPLYNPDTIEKVIKSIKEVDSSAQGDGVPNTPKRSS